MVLFASEAELAVAAAPVRGSSTSTTATDGPALVGVASWEGSIMIDCPGDGTKLEAHKEMNVFLK